MTVQASISFRQAHVRDYLFGRKLVSEVRRALLLFICVFLSSGLLFPISSHGQTPGSDKSESSDQGGVAPGQTSATIGGSGYKVVIPEIRMKRILEGAPEEGAPSGSGRERAPDKASQPDAAERRVPIITVPHTERLPFDPVERRSSPASEREPSAAVDTPEAHPPEPGRDPSAQYSPPPSDRPPTVTPPQVRESVPYEGQRMTRPSPPLAPPRKEAVEATIPGGKEIREPDRSAGTAPAKEEGPRKEEPSFSMRPPKAPEDAVAPPAPPRTEVSKHGSSPGLPPLMKNMPAKETSPALSVGRTEVDEMADPREWIPLEPRREPEIVSMPEPGPSPEAQRESLPEPVHEQQFPVSPVPGPKEVTPTRQLQGSVEEATRPKESIPSEEPPSLPAKEMLPSPLDNDALESAEVREYLRQATPVLEELSLLMTRAPSLAIADYDPSDPNTPPIPKEVQLKMEALKRELQILDSKSFAIIPPKKYLTFHGLIRDSVAETHQACDAIIRYLQESNPENLRSVQEHLRKAKTLIQRSRERSDRG